MKYVFSFLMIMALLPAHAYAYTAYVHSIKATVYKSPSMKSDRVRTVSKGTKLEVSQEQGAWYLVSGKSLGKSKGWVYKFMVKKKPVSDSGRLYSKLKSFFYRIESISSKSRRRPSSYTSTAAARGLREKRKHFADKYNSDYPALETIESIDISEEEAMEFLWKGVKDAKDL